MFANSPAGLILLAFALPAAPVNLESPRSVAPADRTILVNAGLPVEGADLLAFLQRRADPDTALRQVDAAIARFTQNTREEQVAGQIELLGCGPIALPALRRLANRVEQPELATRALHCIGLIEHPTGGNLCLAVARSLVALHPEGTEAVLIRYLPFSESKDAFAEIQQLLVDLCPLQGEVPAPFLNALAGKDPVHRQAVAEILCTARGVAAHPLVRPLLEDPRPTVRIKAALVLTESFDPQAVPVLIEHLASATDAERKQIEDTLQKLAGDWSFQPPQVGDRLAAELRQALWKAWWDALSEERLLALFRSVIHPEEKYLAWQQILARLNDPAAEIRDKAVADLVAIGPAVLPLVRRVASEGTPRERTLATQVVTSLEKSSQVVRLPECAPRLLALRRPGETVAILLDVIPWLESPQLEQQIREVLPSVALQQGKSPPALLDRFRSKLPQVRGMAAAVLARIGTAEELARVRDLLTDADATVRMQAALGLIQRGQRDAVPALIALLGQLPLERAGEVEDFLLELAGDRAPSVGLGGNDEERQKCRDAWLNWWQMHGDRVALTDTSRFRSRPKTLLLVESFDQVRRSGRVLQLDRGGRPLMDLQGLSYPMYAERVGADRILVAEQGTGKITERDLQGRIIKEWATPSAFYCMRLRNGNTFLGGRNQIREVDRDDKVIWTYSSPAETILTMTRFRDGTVTVLTYQGTLVRLDPSGKVVKTSRVPITTLGGINGAEVLPGDRVLCTSTGTNRVVEFDENGKIAWETSIPTPSSVSRLSGGGTLVTTSGGSLLVELDRAGRVVQEWKDLPVRPIRATLR